MAKDKLPPHRFGPGYKEPGADDTYHTSAAYMKGQTKYPYIGSDDNTHSLGIKPHPQGIAKKLLNTVAPKKSFPQYREIGFDETVVLDPDNATKFVVMPKDDRPLLDKLHEATFHETIGLQYIADKYQLRMLCRKAHRYTLDDDTSAKVADFSLAICQDLNAVRQMAHPPFPVTWIDLNNRARLNRISELGGKLTDTAAGKTAAGEAVPRCGWLIWPAPDMDSGTGHYMIHVTEIDQGVIVSPLAWWWDNQPMRPRLTEMDANEELIERITFGATPTNTGLNAFVCPSNIHRDYDRQKLFNWKGRYSGQIRDLMVEIGGELRHLFGFLMGLHYGGTKYREQAAPKRTATAPNGKPLFPLEHKVLTIHLRKNTTIDHLVMRAITKHKMRQHDVRTHPRVLPSGRVIMIPSHKRGDKKLGVITREEKVKL